MAAVSRFHRMCKSHLRKFSWAKVATSLSGYPSARIHPNAAIHASGVKPEVENLSGSAMEHELLDAEDNTRCCANARKSENHCVESTSGSSGKTQDADEATGTWSSSKGSKCANCDVNRDSLSNLSEDMPKETASNGPSSCVKAVVEEEPLEPKLHLVFGSVMHPTHSLCKVQITWST